MYCIIGGKHLYAVSLIIFSFCFYNDGQRCLHRCARARQHGTQGRRRARQPCAGDVVGFVVVVCSV
jgi:hypothetical protein